MTQAEAVLLAYLIIWTLVGHWYVLRRWEMHRKHKARSIAAQKAALTRKRKGIVGKGSPKPQAKAPRAKKTKPPIQDNVVTTDSAWFTLDEEEPEPDYNEVDLLAEWRPKVRRFNGTAKEYAARDQEGDTVG